MEYVLDLRKTRARRDRVDLPLDHQMEGVPVMVTAEDLKFVTAEPVNERADHRPVPEAQEAPDHPVRVDVDQVLVVVVDAVDLKLRIRSDRNHWHLMLELPRNRSLKM